MSKEVWFPIMHGSNSQFYITHISGCTGTGPQLKNTKKQVKITMEDFCVFKSDSISTVTTMANESVCRTRKSVRLRRSVRPRKYLSGFYSSLFTAHWNICDKEVTRSVWRHVPWSEHLIKKNMTWLITYHYHLFATYFKALHSKFGQLTYPSLTIDSHR